MNLHGYENPSGWKEHLNLAFRVRSSRMNYEYLSQNAIIFIFNPLLLSIFISDLTYGFSI